VVAEAPLSLNLSLMQKRCRGRLSAMEFSYRISETDYMRAMQLRRGPSVESRTLRTILFWVFILVCLVMLWTVVERSANQRGVEAPAQTAPTSSPEATGNPAPATTTSPARALLVNVGPFVVFICAWIFVLKRFGPTTLRRLYRKDPAMQGEFTVSVTPQSISIRNTEGTSFTSVWSVYERWREGKNLIVLIFRSGGYSTLNIAGLSEFQRDELRGILAAALPKK
jgi:hypothetical protein